MQMEMFTIKISACCNWNALNIINITIFLKPSDNNIHNRYSGLYCSCTSYRINM